MSIDPETEQQQLHASIASARRRIQWFEFVQFIGVALGIIGTSASVGLLTDSPWRWLALPLICVIALITYALNKVSHARNVHDAELFKLHALLLRRQSGNQ